MGNIDILLVEDNPHDAEMILETLSQQNISTRVHAISDGAEALDYLFGPQGCLAKAEADWPIAKEALHECYDSVLLRKEIPLVGKFGGLNHVREIENLNP
jgi:CheY-like chemotaxis protein